MNRKVLETQICRRWPGRRESVEEMIDRVVTTLVKVENSYGTSVSEMAKIKSDFESVIHENLFWPSGRTLNNAGSRQSQLASCFVLPLQDDFDAILDTLHIAARCHRTGGGTGFDFSALREQGAVISTSEAAGSSGPIPWMRLFDVETITVMSGGKMRGANMGVLSVYHPDILKFIRAKSNVGDLSTFNISVSIDDAFMAKLEQDETVDLVSPHDGRVVSTLPAQKIWSEIAAQAWKTGDPGLLFISHINRHNPLIRYLGPITTTNPCGEQTLYNFEASNLGSINLSALYDLAANDVDWDKLAHVVKTAVRMLDNVIDACQYPYPPITQNAKFNRRLGLGVMGYADLLVKLNLRYDSQEAIQFCAKLAKFIQDTAWKASEKLAGEKGPFLNYPHSTFERPVRNCAITSIAPTGTISMIAECSSSIEPRFAPAYKKNVIDSNGLDFYDQDLVSEIQSAMKLSHEDALELLTSKPFGQLALPPEILHRYRYSHDISGYWHVTTAATWQRFIDNGVSKTVNLREEATVDDVSEIFLEAWRQGCKGISIYRAGSRSLDLLTVARVETANQPIIQSKELTKSPAFR